MLSKLHFGWRVEREAEAWFLERFPAACLLERNFRCRGGEVDLIFELEREPVPEELGRSAIELVFVEVRARTAGVAWETGLESVRAAKQRRLARTVAVYLARYRGKARSVRLDILAWDGCRWQHVPDLRDLAGAGWGF